jgi:hypothetical protein
MRTDTADAIVHALLSAEAPTASSSDATPPELQERGA